MAETHIENLRSLLLSKQATWSLTKETNHATTASSVNRLHQLGALPTPASTPTAHMPRMRPAPDAAVHPAQPGANRILQQTAAGVPLPGMWDSGQLHHRISR